MRIHIDRERMAFLRSMGLEGRPLWDAIEGLRKDLAQTGSVEITDRPGRRQMNIKIGLRSFWLGWELSTDRGETVITIALAEES